MSTDFNALMSGLNLGTDQQSQSPPPNIQEPAVSTTPSTPTQHGNPTDQNQHLSHQKVERLESPLFETAAFKQLVKEDSVSRNRSYARNTTNIGGYDIAHNCIKTTLFRMLGYTPTNYANSWLPLGFRAALGTAVHAYIQDLGEGKIFTESEVCLKVPSKRISMRLDNLINDETLVEIKSCSYADYKKILSSNKPRLGDLHQAIFYKYLLQNHLEEMKLQEPTRGGARPGLDDYSNIKYIQMIYVCHEIITGESELMSDEVKYATAVRKLAKKESGISDFWFIAPLVMDLSTFDVAAHEAYLVEKLETIIKYADLKQMPLDNNKFVDNSKCFFCQFKDQCNAH